jgi:hypothetical protein
VDQGSCRLCLFYALGIIELSLNSLNSPCSQNTVSTTPYHRWRCQIEDAVIEEGTVRNSASMKSSAYCSSNCENVEGTSFISSRMNVVLRRFSNNLVNGRMSDGSDGHDIPTAYDIINAYLEQIVTWRLLRRPTAMEVAGGYRIHTRKLATATAVACNVMKQS